MRDFGVSLELHHFGASLGSSGAPSAAGNSSHVFSLAEKNTGMSVFPRVLGMVRQVSKAELSELIGRDERTISRWQASGMPVLEVGKGRGGENIYDTQAVFAWLMQRASLNGKKESARDRLDRVRADREELALAKELGEVVIAADLVDRYEAMIQAAKTELLNTFPENLASDLSARYGMEVDDQLIREPLDAILTGLANYDPLDSIPDEQGEEYDDLFDGDYDGSEDPEDAEGFSA